MNRQHIITTELTPNLADINQHLFVLFSPDFVKAYPDAWIEIAHAMPNGLLDGAGMSAFWGGAEILCSIKVLRS